MRVHGVGFVTDESPPTGPKWSGHRFQVTIIYIPRVLPISEWEKPKWNIKPPLITDSFLTDNAHAPGKDVATVSKIVAKQLDTERILGVTRYM